MFPRGPCDSVRVSLTVFERTGAILSPSHGVHREFRAFFPMVPVAL